MSIIGDLFQEIIDFVRGLISDFSQLLHIGADVFSLVQDLKGYVKKLEDDAAKEIKGIIDDGAKFKERIKDVKHKLIRADLAFEIYSDLVNGELKKFLENEFAKIAPLLRESTDKLKSTADAWNEAGSAIRQLSPQNLTTNFGQKVLGGIQSILAAWVTVGKVMNALTGIVPLLKEIRSQLKKFEGIVLPQDSQREQSTEPYRKRVR